MDGKKSCTTNLGWLKAQQNNGTQQNNGMFTIYVSPLLATICTYNICITPFLYIHQLVIWISLAHPQFPPSNRQSSPRQRLRLRRSSAQRLRGHLGRCQGRRTAALKSTKKCCWTSRESMGIFMNLVILQKIHGGFRDFEEQSDFTIFQQDF